MQLQKLKDITAPDKVDAEKNKERFAELNIITWLPNITTKMVKTCEIQN